MLVMVPAHIRDYSRNAGTHKIYTIVAVFF